MNFNALVAPVAFAALIAAGGAAVAGPTVYTTQASFLAAISAPGVDTFDDLEPSTLPSPQDRSAGAYSYTASVGPTNPLFFPASEDGVDLWLASYDRTDTITFGNFSAGVRGAGGFFFGSDAGGLFTTADSLTITATDASGTSTEFLVKPTTTSFLGFVSTGALTSLTVAVGVSGTDPAGVWPTINDLTLGTAVAAVPEPETYALMLGGLGLVGWISRRRKA